MHVFACKFCKLQTGCSKAMHQSLCLQKLKQVLKLGIRRRERFKVNPRKINLGSKSKDFFFFNLACLPHILCPDAHIKHKLPLFMVLIYFSQEHMATNCIYRQVYKNFITFSLTKSNHVLSIFAIYQSCNYF